VAERALVAHKENHLHSSLRDAWRQMYLTGIYENGYSGETWTWRSRHQRIDYVWVSQHFQITSVSVEMDADAYDHVPIFAAMVLT